jgi:hypothetical protein
MAHIGSLPPGSQPMGGAGPVRGPVSMGGGQPPLNGFNGPQMHQLGMGPMTPMHGMSPVHGPPGVVLNQQMPPSQTQVRRSPLLISYPSNKSNVDVYAKSIPAGDGEHAQERQP